MQKFLFVFLVFVTVLLALAPSVEGSAIGERETNAERFARGMNPLPPVKRSRTEAAQRRKPSTRPHHGHHGHHDDHGDHGDKGDHHGDGDRDHDDWN